MCRHQLPLVATCLDQIGPTVLLDQQDEASVTKHRGPLIFFESLTVVMGGSVMCHLSASSPMAFPEGVFTWRFHFHDATPALVG